MLFFGKLPKHYPVNREVSSSFLARINLEHTTDLILCTAMDQSLPCTLSLAILTGP